MKAESLNALLIDQELGELSPEAVELLDSWLAEHPQAAGARPAIRRTLQATTAAIRRFPALAQPEAHTVLSSGSYGLRSLALAASIMVLLAGTGWVAFRAGRISAPTPEANIQSTPMNSARMSKRSGGPWARYELGLDARGGLTVVRREQNSQQ